MVNKKYAFAIENASMIRENPNSKFATVELDFFASGTNLHNLYVSEETLLRTAETIKNCPIVWKYSETLDDVYTHDPEETICGFVPENSPIKTKKLPDGRTMLSTVAYVWNRYTGRLLDIFKRDGGKKPVSVEMVVYDIKQSPNGEKELRDFRYEGITVLGSFVTPAIPLASASILSFAELQKEYIEDYKKEFPESNIRLPDSFSEELKVSMLEQDNEEILGHNEPEKEEKTMTVKKVKDVAEQELPIVEVEQLSQPETPEAEADIVVENTTEELDSVLEVTDEDKVVEESVEEEVEVIEEEDNEEVEESENDPLYSDFVDTLRSLFPEEEREESMVSALADFDKDSTNVGLLIPTAISKLEKLSSEIKSMSEQSQAQLSEIESLRKFKAEVEDSQKSFAIDKVIRELEEKVIIPEEAKAEMIADAENYSFAEIEKWETVCKAKSFDFAVRESEESSVFVKKAGLPFGETTANLNNVLWQ